MISLFTGDINGQRQVSTRKRKNVRETERKVHLCGQLGELLLRVTAPPP